MELPTDVMLWARKIVAMREAEPMDAESAALLAASLIGDTEQEKFGVIALTRMSKKIDAEVLFVGGRALVVVDPTVVFRWALTLEQPPACLVVFHNHPSGGTNPSSEDITLTRRLVKCGLLLGVPVLDHIIVSGADYVSLKDTDPYLFKLAAPLEPEE